MAGKDKKVANHTTIIPPLLSAIVFSIPAVILYFMGLDLPLLVYCCVMIYLMVTAIANIKYRNEIYKNVKEIMDKKNN